MLKLIFIFVILFLFCTTLIWADVDEFIGVSTVDEYLGISTIDEVVGQAVAGGAGTSDPCSGGSPGDPGDVLCESFEDDAGDGYKDAAWTDEDGGANCTITVKQAHSGDGDFDCSTRGDAYIDINGTDDYECGISNTNPNSEDPVYIALAVKVISHALAPAEDFYVIRDTVPTFGLRAHNDGGTLKWELYHKDRGNNDEKDLGSSISVGDTWYRHRIKVDANCGTEGVGDDDCLQWWVATNDGSFSEQTIEDDSASSSMVFTGIWLGEVNRSPEADFNVHVDNFLIDDDDTGLDTCD